MPVQNGELFIAQAIESIIGQSHKNLELIVIDDGSEDRSLVIAGDYARVDPRVRVERSKGIGIAEALETGLSIASGDWIARMDCDDISVPHRLQTQLAWMEKKGIDVCGSFVETFGAEQRLYRFPESHTAICHELVFRCPLMHPSVLMRKEVFQKETYRKGSCFEDYDLFTRLAGNVTLGNIQEVLLYYRRHANQVTARRKKELNASMAVSRFRYVYSRFPKTSVSPYAALCRLCESRPAVSIEDFDFAGQWIVKLADISDCYVSNRMALRWKDHWTLSRQLGKEADRLFFHYQNKIENQLRANGSSFVTSPKKPTQDLPFDRVEVDLTTACDLKCKQCNRSCGKAPAREELTPEQFELFIDRSLDCGIHWKIITLMGGEPTLHKGLTKIYAIAFKYKQQFDCVIELATNGYGRQARKAIQDAPWWIQVRNGNKTGSKQLFTAFCMAPRDNPDLVGFDFSVGCKIPEIYGLGFSRHGIYSCGPGASIDRIMGFGLGILDPAQVTSQALKEQREKLCPYCGHFTDQHSNPYSVDDSSESISWENGYKNYNIKHPCLPLFGNSGAEHF